MNDLAKNFYDKIKKFKSRQVEIIVKIIKKCAFDKYFKLALSISLILSRMKTTSTLYFYLLYYISLKFLNCNGQGQVCNLYIILMTLNI